jgi:hypothetical protein
VCDALDSKFAKKLVFIIIFLKSGVFAQCASEKWEIFVFAEGSFFLRQRYFENFQVSRRHLLGNSWKNQRAEPTLGREGLLQIRP